MTAVRNPTCDLPWMMIVDGVLYGFTRQRYKSNYTNKGNITLLIQEFASSTAVQDPEYFQNGIKRMCNNPCCGNAPYGDDDDDRVQSVGGSRHYGRKIVTVWPRKYAASIDSMNEIQRNVKPCGIYLFSEDIEECIRESSIASRRHTHELCDIVVTPHHYAQYMDDRERSNTERNIEHWFHSTTIRARRWVWHVYRGGGEIR